MRSVPDQLYKKAPAPSPAQGLLEIKFGGDLLSHGGNPAVPSALESLTSVFGMGTGVSSPPSPPKDVSTYRARPARQPLLQTASEIFHPLSSDQAARAISTG